MDQQQLIASVVQEVLKQIGGATSTPAVTSGASGRPGIFSDVNNAVKTAARAQEQGGCGECCCQRRGATSLEVRVHQLVVLMNTEPCR